MISPFPFVQDLPSDSDSKDENPSPPVCLQSAQLDTDSAQDKILQDEENIDIEVRFARRVSPQPHGKPAEQQQSFL